MLSRFRQHATGQDRGSTGAQLARGGAASILIRSIGTFVNFALVVTLARLLGAEAYGVYAIALAILTVVAIPVQAGLANVVVREVARTGFRDNSANIRAMLSWAAVVIAVYFLAVMLVFGVLGALWPGAISADRATALLAGLLLIPGFGLANACAAALRGIGRMVAGLSLDTLIRPGVLILLVLAAMLLAGPTLRAPHVMGLHVAAAFAAFAAGALVLRGALAPPPGTPGAAPGLAPGVRRAWLAALLPLSLVSGLQVVNSQVGMLLIGAFRTDAEAGLYRAAIQMSSLVVFGLMAINQVLLPHISRLWADGQKTELQRFVTLSARAILALALVPALLFVGFGQSLIGLIFGAEYLDAHLPLVILAFGQLANAAFGTVGALLNMTGHERDTMRGMAVALATNGVLALVLVPWFGMTGAALSTALSFVVWNVVLKRFVRIRLGIESMAFAWRRPEENRD